MVESRKILEDEAILVATDGSPDAGAALAAATELCQKTGGSLHLAHTLPDVNAPLVGDPARFEEEGTSLLEEAEAQVSGAGLRVEKHLLSGTPFHEIVRLSDEIRAGLIVMGSRGLGLLGRLTLGSVTEAVCHHASRPVLVLRGGDAAWPPGRVVVADDGSPAPAGSSCGPTRHRRITAWPRRGRRCTSGEPGFRSGWRASSGAPSPATRRRCRSAPGSSRSSTGYRSTRWPRWENRRISPWTPPPGEEEASTLVAVGSRGLGALRRMWLGSVSTNLLRATRGPVLLHPVPKEVQ